MEVRMPRRNIYVRDQDQALWERAEQLTGDESLSHFLTEALRVYIREREGSPMDRIQVYLEDKETGRSHLKAFVGRWLLTERRSQHEGEGGRLIGVEYSVAETARGNIVVLAGRHGEYDGMSVYESLDEVETAGWPADIITAAAAEMGIERAELLDI
jgi:hypothetical protein